MHLHFRLRPVDDVAPWIPVPSQNARTPDWLRRPNLDWFALTLGWFWIEVGQAELFRYSQAAIDAMVREQPDAPWASEMLEIPYDGYQVARQWDNLLTILPDVLEPVPARLAAALGPDGPWTAWVRQAETVVVSALLNGGAWDLLEDAAGWWGKRHLDTAYLQAGPQIWFWSDGSNAHIEWDNRGLTIDFDDDPGVPVWETLLGHHTVPVADFLEEVRSFDARFMRQMHDRVESAQNDWARPEIALPPDLGDSHLAHTRMMQQRMESIARHAPTAWDEVFRAIARIEALPTFPAGARLAL